MFRFRPCGGGGDFKKKTVAATNKPMRYLLLVLLMIFPRVVFAISSSRIPDALLIEQGIKNYENKEYKTADEYKSAFMNGKCSSMWLWIHLDKEGKVSMIENLKRTAYEKEKIVINKPAQFYVDAIDEVAASDSNAPQFRLFPVFKTIAIMEYDYDEGIDKDETARNWFGDYYKAVAEYRK